MNARRVATLGIALMVAWSVACAAPRSRSPSPVQAQPGDVPQEEPPAPAGAGQTPLEAPSDACQQACERRRMAEAIAWEAIVEGCRRQCEAPRQDPGAGATQGNQTPEPRGALRAVP